MVIASAVSMAVGKVCPKVAEESSSPPDRYAKPFLNEEIIRMCFIVVLVLKLFGLSPG